MCVLNSLRLNLRNANLQAKANLRKAAQEEAIYAYLFILINLSILVFILLKCFSGFIFWVLFGTSSNPLTVNQLIISWLWVCVIHICLNWWVGGCSVCDMFYFYMMQRELLLGGGEESTVRRRNLQYVLGAIFSWVNICFTCFIYHFQLAWWSILILKCVFFF